MRRAARALLPVGLFLGTIAVAGRAHADTGAAEVLFRAGRDAAKRGDHAEACRKFRESNRLEPSVGTELNLAMCEEQLGNLLRAWQLFKMVAEKLAPHDDRQAMVGQHLATLDERLPRITLKASSPLPEDTEISQGGTRLSVSSLGVAIPVDVGEKVITVSAPNHETSTYRVQVREGQRVELVVGLRRSAPRAAAKPGALEAESGGSKTWGILALGVGASGLAVGAVTGVGVLEAKSQMNDDCDPDGACSQIGLDAAGRGETLAVVSTVSFALGAVCAAAGGFLLLEGKLWGKTEKGRSTSLRLNPTGISLRSDF
jgi:hypothetical protein